MLVAPGVYDGLSARVAAGAGAEAVYMSGGAVARSAGIPDIGLLTMTEVLGRLREIVDAVTVPVVADADTGYGNALNVGRTVEEFERLGVAAIHLEDQITPKRCGHYDGKELVSAAEMVGKLRAAVEARREMLIIARTDAIATEGIEGAIRRAHLYAETGVDAIFVEAPETEEQIARVASEIDAPLVINMFVGGKTPLVPREKLEELGYRLMIVPSDLQRAATKAMQETVELLLSKGDTEELSDRMVTFAERDQLVGLDHYRELELRFAPESQQITD